LRWVGTAKKTVSKNSAPDCAARFFPYGKVENQAQSKKKADNFAKQKVQAFGFFALCKYQERRTENRPLESTVSRVTCVTDSDFRASRKAYSTHEKSGQLMCCKTGHF
jgi:hypothetical protein